MKNINKNKWYITVCKALTVILLMPVLTAGTANKKTTDKQPPSTPRNLAVNTVGYTEVSLSWTASYDKQGEVRYIVYQDGRGIATVATATYTAAGLEPGTEYVFAVKAQDASGNLSGLSNTVYATTLPQTEPTPAPTATFAAEPTDTPAPTAAPTAEPSPTAAPAATAAPTTAPTATATPGVTSAPTPTPAPTLAPTAAPAQKMMVGYYASWAAYNGYTPLDIPAGELTHINYAFANIGTDLKIAMGDSTVDPTNFSQLNALKKAYPHLKTLISVGGWTWSGRFSDAALTDASRTAFADSVVAFITKYGFDGVDLDWEYPVSGGLSSNVCRPEDKTNFTLLLQKLRQKLDARGAADGREYLLTIAGGAGSFYINNTQPSLIKNYVDYANVMTYDMHGPWDPYTDFNAPLYTPSENTLQYKWSVNATVKAWTAAGFPGNKIVLGMPFYGYLYSGVTGGTNGLYGRFTSSRSISYDEIVKSYLTKTSFKQYIHADAQAPWLFDGSTFITYDNAESLRLKAQYIQQNELAGACIWELSQNRDGSLVQVLHDGMQ